jgi:periplasmic mercuric ion binding protein
MKTKKIMIAFMAVLTMSVAFVNAQAVKTGVEKVTFNVNMTCQNCVNKVEKNIAFEKGVKTMDVNLEAKTVTLTYDSKKTDKVKLQEAITKLGFVVSETSVKGDKACCSKTSVCADKKEGGCCKDSIASKTCSDKKEGACCKEGTAAKACADKKEGACCKEGTAAKACADKKEGACCKSEVVASSDAKKASACCQTSVK